MSEVWKAIVGYEGYYEVSDYGRVRSLDRYVGHNCGGLRLYKGHLCEIRAKTIYPAVSLSRDGKVKRFHIHELVLTAFRGTKPAKAEACHKDGDGWNNRVDNLRWDTKSGNAQDRSRHRRANLSEGHGNSRLLNEDVARIREAYLFGARRSDLAKAHGITRHNVGRIVRRETWEHLS